MYGELPAQPGMHARTPVCRLSWAKRITAPLCDVTVAAVVRQSHEWRGWRSELLPTLVPSHGKLRMGAEPRDDLSVRASHPCSVSEAAESH